MMSYFPNLRSKNFLKIEIFEKYLKWLETELNQDSNDNIKLIAELKENMYNIKVKLNDKERILGYYFMKQPLEYIDNVNFIWAEIYKFLYEMLKEQKCL